MRLTTPDYGKNRLVKVDSADVSDEYITLTQAKLWLRKDGTDEDTLIQEALNEAIETAETMLGRSLREKRYTAIWSEFKIEVPLPYVPVSEIVSVQRIDGNGDFETITDYYLLGDSIIFKKRYSGGLKVVYDTGVDSSPVKGAIKQMLLTNYEDRQDNAEMIMEIPSNSRKKLMRYKRYVN